MVVMIRLNADKFNKIALNKENIYSITRFTVVMIWHKAYKHKKLLNMKFKIVVGVYIHVK